MTISHLSRGRGRIAYDVHGSGPLVLCVPGMGELRSAYRFTVPALVAAGYRVATMDLRGHGDSDDDFDTFDHAALASDIGALVRHLDGPAIVIGNSMAAGAAVIAHADHPDSIVGLALLAPFVRNPSSNALVGLTMRALLLKPWGPHVWGAYYRRLFPGRQPVDMAEHRAAMSASFSRGTHWRSFRRTARTSHAPAEARLGEVRCPALVVMGARDPDWKDATAEASFVAAAVDAELLMVPEAGHYPMTEYPELVNPRLVAFVSSVFARA
ncbi:alpha/beta fold hydrolase [Planctomonas psychrotolerans]|uniref:alpha/beta fold hydrolase n=1 Tax=Planctomonas psychrotolerans TaxID=2528712 RepID=UPI00123C13A2|nr:alpha/beta hydrolase [Planctomonas psychrotolerans]